MAFNFIDVVRYGGGETRDIFAWRHPNTELKAGTKVTVMPHQIAIFVKNGRIAQTFREGTRVVEGNSTPFLTGMTKMFTGGVNPNDARMYFINLNDRTNVGWGTPSPVNIPVPGNVGPRSAGLTIPAGANGAYSIALAYIDPDRRPGPQTDQYNADHIDAFFRQFVSDREVTTVDDVVDVIRQKANGIIHDTLAKVLIEGGVDINRIDARLSEIGQQLTQRLQEPFAQMERQYGVRVFDFVLNAIVLDKSSREYLQYAKRAQAFEDSASEAETRRFTGVMDSETKLMQERLDAMGDMAHTDAKAYDQQQRNYTFQQEHMFDVYKTAAGNTGSGSDLMSGGIGLGVGLGVGGSLVRGLNEAVSSMGSIDLSPAGAAGAAGGSMPLAHQPLNHQPVTPNPAAASQTSAAPQQPGGQEGVQQPGTQTQQPGVQPAAQSEASQPAAPQVPLPPQPGQPAADAGRTAPAAQPGEPAPGGPSNAQSEPAAAGQSQPAQPQRQSQSPEEAIHALETLKKAHELGLISDEQFATKQQEILSRL